jgi:hypothetical protein
MRMQVGWIAMFVVLVAVATPTGAAAQEWCLDAYGGWSYSGLSGKSSNLLGGDYKSGFGGGVGAELKLNEDWGWEFGLWYVQKGAQGSFANDAENHGFLPRPTDEFDGTVYLDYIEVPILVNVYFPVGETTLIRGFIGPAFAFLTRSEAEGLLNGSSTAIDLGDDLDDADITVMIGAGAQFDLQSVSVLVDFRWDIGATNVSNVDETALRNSTVLITAGIGIPLTRP